MGGFREMTAALLKEELRSRGLSVSGKKSELIKRLEHFDATITQDKQDDKSGVPCGAVDVELAQPASVEEPSAGVHKSDEKTNEPGVVQNSNKDAVAKRIERFGPSVLGDEEKAQLRAERFNQAHPLTDPNALESRAARFGILTEQALKDKEIARAKRFGVDTPELIEQKKRAREERFAQPMAKNTANVSEIEALIHKRTQV